MPITDIIDRLTPSQKQAVTTTEGPVLVIAGPGTGKTEVLAARIAHLIDSGKAPASEILCLTYTDAGVVAMRNRLAQFIGPDAYKVTISTFHSFCAGVINEQTDHFGVSGLLAISELEQLHIVRRIVDGFSMDHPLARPTGDIYFETSRLTELYSIMKQEGWTPEYLVGRVDAWLASLRDDPEFQYKRAGKNKDGVPYKKGDVNEGKIQEATRKGEQLKAAALSFDDYQALLRKNRRYDFADMILWCVDLFQTDPSVLTEYQERFSYLLVDEFQDTGGAQYDLLSLLCDYSDAPNVFAVGDDDQSIYRFQGASVENIRRFEQRYESKLTTISLVENYRSSQKILDAATMLIARNNERLGVDKTLVAKNNDVADLPHDVAVQSYPTVAQETVAVINGILAQVEAGTPPEGIAVIYRNHRQSEDIIKALAAKGIEYSVRQRVDVLKDPLAHRMINILQYLHAESSVPGSGEHLLFTMLHDRWFGISPLSLAQIAVAMRKFPEQAISWRSMLAGGHASVPGSINQDEAARLLKASTLLEDLISHAANNTLLDVLSRIIVRLGLSDGEDQGWSLLVLNTLYEFARDETEKRLLTAGGLAGLLIDMQDNNISLPVTKPGNSQGVNLVTAHGAKGLQFDHVFLIGCNAKAWDSAGRSRTYSFPPTIWRNALGGEEEESRRLFYVAMTRARKTLTVSYAERDNNAKELESSRFVSELITGDRTVQRGDVSAADLQAFGQAVIAEPKTEKKELLYDPELIGSLLEGYSLSVSHLNKYLRCPTAFYYEVLLKVPTPRSAAAIFGSAVHHALELAHKKIASGAGGASREQFIGYFQAYMERSRFLFAPAEYSRRYEYGADILGRYHDRFSGEWDKNVLVEKAVHTSYGNVPINGKIDKIRKLTTRAITTEYKTGKLVYAKRQLAGPNPDKAEKAFVEGKKPEHQDLHGGDYWRQAVFYRILDHLQPVCNVPVTETVFDFIEPDPTSGDFVQVPVEVTDADMELVAGQIVEVHDKIMRHEFADGCGDPDCEWCALSNK